MALIFFVVSFVLEPLQIFDNPLKQSGFFSTSLPLIPVLSHFFPSHFFFSSPSLLLLCTFIFLYSPLAALLSDSLFEVKLSPYDEESQA